MCGVIGAFGKHAATAVFPLEELSHRGPDACGEWASRNGFCRLGHVRLSILELSPAGAQPMVSASGRTVLVFNGEIYNHREIRSQIYGVEWRGHSDSETLVEAWEAFGQDCLHRLRGMFAFAVYDSYQGTLHLVRDRLGIKPLYYRREPEGGLSFCSEARALLGGRRPVLGRDALACYLATGHTPNYGLLGDGIEIFPPGSVCRIDEKGKSVFSRWWSIPHEAGSLCPFSSREEALLSVRETVVKAVAEHSLSDVPVASFLSGGIDSSIVSLAAAQSLGSSLHTFCIGFPDAGFDERRIAALVAKRAGSQHSEIEITPSECQQWAMEAVGAMDVPSADAINTYIVSKAVRQAGFKVALSGLGGDELFCGYPSFRDIPRLALLGKIPPAMARLALLIMPGDVRQKLEGAESFDPFTLALLRRRWWGCSALAQAGLEGKIPWPKAGGAFSDTIQAVSAAEILGYMEPMLLRDSDQMSMAVGLELRVPLLDHRLVELAMCLPGGWKAGRPAKKLLVDTFKDILPAAVWDRPKQGFALPMDSWMREPLMEFCRDGAESAKKVLGAAFVEGAKAGFGEGKLHWTRLWQIAVLGHYIQH
jgi:asparagine synthase (glutamine-hydrolysing)